jgi:hypothetical protein
MYQGLQKHTQREASGSGAANTRPYILALSGLVVWLENHLTGRFFCYAEHDIAYGD